MTSRPLLWCTLFHRSLERVHLDKDVGMIPAYARSRLGCAAWFVASGPDVDPSTRLRALGVEWWPAGPGIVSLVTFLLRHARRVDILHLYFTTGRSILLGLLYRLLNPRGVLWIKSDWSTLLAAQFSVGGARAMVRREMLRAVTRGRTLVSAESQAARASLESTFEPLRGRVAVLPNGIDDLALVAPLPAPRPFDRKEPLILCVGRIGTLQKNLAMILGVLEDLDLGDWHLAFVGPVEPSFAALASRLFERQPRLRQQVVFAGEVRSRSELYDWYDRARVLCLPSWYEGFPLVSVEALAFGHHLLLSDQIWGAEEVTAGGKFGVRIPPDDPAAWRRALARIVAGGLEDHVTEAAAHARSMFAWSRILDDAGVRLGVEVNPGTDPSFAPPMRSR